MADGKIDIKLEMTADGIRQALSDLRSFDKVETETARNTVKNWRVAGATVQEFGRIVKQLPKEQKEAGRQALAEFKRQEKEKLEAVKEATKEHLRFEKQLNAEIERDRRRSANELKRQERQAANDRQYFARRAGYGVGRGIMGSFSTAARYAGMALTLGGGATFGSAIQEELAASRIATDIQIQSRGAIPRAAVLASAHKARRLTNISEEDYLEAQRNLVIGTGDPAFAQSIMPEITKIAKAENIEAPVLGKALAKIRAENRNVTNEELFAMTRAAVGQQKSTMGAISAEDILENMPTVMAFAPRHAGNRSVVQAELASMLNPASIVSKSPAQAATDIASMEQAMGQKATRKKLMAAGIDVYDKAGNLKDPYQIYSEMAGKLTQKQVGEIFGRRAGVAMEGVKAAAGITEEDVRSGQGMQKALDYFKKLGEQTLTPEEIQEDLRQRMSAPEEQLETAINKMKDAFTQPEMLNSLTSLATSLSELAPAMASVVQSIAGMIKWFADHPIAGSALAFWIIALGGALKELTAAVLGEAARIGFTKIFGGPGGAAAEGAAGAAGGVAGRLASGAAAATGWGTVFSEGLGIFAGLDAGRSAIKRGEGLPQIGESYMNTMLGYTPVGLGIQGINAIAGTDLDPAWANPFYKGVKELLTAFGVDKPADDVSRPGGAIKTQSITINADSVNIGGSAGPRSSTGAGFNQGPLGGK